jgi:hypothetical protein
MTMAIPMTRIAEKRASGSLERLDRLVVSNHTPEELALGYLRYEAIRRMSPRTFGEIYKLNLSGRIFDDLVDEALKAWKWPQEPNDQSERWRRPSAPEAASTVCPPPFAPLAGSPFKGYFFSSSFGLAKSPSVPPPS